MDTLHNGIYQKLTTAVIVLLQFGAARQVHLGSTRPNRSQLARTNPVLDLLGHGDKGLLDVGGVFGGRFQKGNIERVGVIL